MQHVIFDPTIIINHGLKILEPNSITNFIYLILCGVMSLLLMFNHYSTCGPGGHH